MSEHIGTEEEKGFTVLYRITIIVSDIFRLPLKFIRYRVGVLG